LALLQQPTVEAIATCRQQGYGVLALGESPQADVLGLPLGWRDLQGWLLEQLPEGRPEVVLVGTQEGEAGELSKRLQQGRPQWGLVASPLELPPRPDAMQLPALPGWDREDLRILASSNGLHADGWLETPSRLVIQLLGGDEEHAKGLRFGLYLPEQGLQVADPTVWIQLDAAEPRSQALQPGLNPVVLRCPEPPLGGCFVLLMSSASMVRPVNASDQRRLMAVLVDLALDHVSADTEAAAVLHPLA
jgi:hypothetical protein